MIISNQTKELSIKIGYHGPGLAGKTTSIQYIYSLDNREKENELRSTYYDSYGHLLFCETNLKEEYNGWKVKLILSAKVGAIYLNEGNYKVLENIDGIIFMADSQVERLDANIEYLYFLDKIFEHFGYVWEKMPYALQLNKRDLSNILSVDEMLKELQNIDRPFFESIAYKGIGVRETLHSIIQQIVQNDLP